MGRPVTAGDGHCPAGKQVGPTFRLPAGARVLLYPGWGPQVLAPAIPPVTPPWLMPPMVPVKDPPMAFWST